MAAGQGMAQAVSHLVSVANAGEIQSMCSALSDNRVNATASRRSVEHELGSKPTLVQAFCTLQSQWRVPPGSTFDNAAVSLAIQTCYSLKTQMSVEKNSLELVWTGPRPHGSVVRATGEVMKEMVSRCRSSVILMGYSITSSASEVLGMIASAARDDRQVTIIFRDTSGNRSAITDSWPTNVQPPRLLSWGGDPSKPLAALHAKMLLVDTDDLLITSANLTYHGLEANLELGVRIRGPFVQTVLRHLVLLERERLLVEL